MKISIATLVLLASAAAAAPAMATVPAPGAQDTHTARVRYGDLNASTESGAEQLYGRLSFAAHEVCSDVTAPSYLTLNRAYQDCRRQALENAVAHLDQPKLTALYDHHGRAAHTVG